MLGGVLCRVAVLTSLALGTLNSATVEVSTPRFADPDGLLFCVATPGAALTREAFTLAELKSGGSQFADPTQTVLDAQSTPALGWETVAFFQAAATSWGQGALEVGTLYDVLANDPHYAASYRRQRYDDLGHAPHGNAHLVSKAGVGEGPANCALLTGDWAAGTRYQLTFNFTNPAVGAGAEDAALKFWHAPLTYTKIDDAHLRYSVRGSKQGQMCAESPGLLQYGSSTSGEMALYDACDAAAAVLGGTSVDPEACLEDLRPHYESDGLPGSDTVSSRVNVYKSALGMGVSTSGVTNSTCSGSNEAFSAHFGGECIDCGSGAVAYTSQGGGGGGALLPLSCTCPNPQLERLVGSPACAQAESLVQSTAGVSTEKEVADYLCTFYTGKYESLLARETSALTVARGYVDDFLAQAHLLLDRDEMQRLNATFVASFLFDERNDADGPTRKRGVKPNCYHCDQGGFTDFDSGARVDLANAQADVFFDAVHTFRLIGYALGSLGYPCDSLFSLADPFRKGDYGDFSTDVCQTL